jgi:hydroxymethylbilane synthase
MKPIIIGTRGSPLALAQVVIIKGLLQTAHPGLVVEQKIIKTSGDKLLDVSLAAAGGKGLFTKEIEEHLLRGDIDLAIHSLKDLPTTMPDGLTLGAVPRREDPHDVFVSKRYQKLDELPLGARVATGSIRRKAQLLARRPDLKIEEIRGNVGTRLQKLADQPDLAATILAAAGLRRLGLWGSVLGYYWQSLDIEVMIPAVGQGIIGCQVRTNDFATQEALAAINDADTLARAEAERVFLRTMGGGCQAPYAAHATVNGNDMKLIGAAFSHDGKQVRRAQANGPKSDPMELGERVAGQVGHVPES